MAGLWHLSHHQMRRPNGDVFAGAKAYFYAAASNSKIPVYADYGLGTALPNPVPANAFGIFPPVFFDEADNFYRQIITDADGVTIPGTDVGTIPIIGPSGGGGGSEVPVDPTAIAQIGDLTWKPVAGTRPGWVRSNARTIGSATSGANERANDDCEQLYLYLWGAYDNLLCPVVGGRGVSAAADWAANKPIGTLDMRGIAPFGLDGMGNSRANVIADSFVAAGDGDTAASGGGADGVAILQANLPAVTLATKIPAGQGAHRHGSRAGASPTGAYSTYFNYAAEPGTPTATEEATLPEMSGTTPLGGSGAEVNKLPPFRLGTWYMKL